MPEIPLGLWFVLWVLSTSIIGGCLGGGLIAAWVFADVMTQRLKRRLGLVEQDVSTMAEALAWIRWHLERKQSKQTDSESAILPFPAVQTAEAAAEFHSSGW